LGDLKAYDKHQVQGSHLSSG